MKKKRFYNLVLSLLIMQFALFQNLNAQSRTNYDIQTLEKLDAMMTRDNKAEFEAKKTVFSYRTEVKNELAQIMPIITTEKYKQLYMMEYNFWTLTTENLKLYNSYDKFLRANYSKLEIYKEEMLKEFSYAVRAR